MTKWIEYTDENGKKKLRKSDDDLKRDEERKKLYRERKERMNKYYRNRREYHKKSQEEKLEIDEIEYNNREIRRFWGKVIKKSEDECWEWTGRIDKYGYGQFYYNKKMDLAHRASYLIHYNEIPENKPYITHTCHNRGCVNPKHLKADTHQGNMNDMINSGRSAKGEDNGRAKLTWEIVRNIRERYIDDITLTTVSLAKEYDVADSTILAILKNEIWKDNNYIPIPIRKLPSERSGFAKLTWKKVNEIRERIINGNVTRVQLSKEYGVGVDTISDIISNTTWFEDKYQKRLEDLMERGLLDRILKRMFLRRKNKE